MDITQYAAAKQRLLNRMLAALFLVFKQFLRGFMSARDWNSFMHVTYQVVKPFRDEATELARTFFDANRAAQQPTKPRQDIFKDDHFPETWFRQSLRPVFDNLQTNPNVDAAISEISNRVIKIVEDGARRTIIQGVVADHDSPIRGFARFDPRPPTCAFCTMMISRGPVYHTKRSAGIVEVAQDELEKTILNGSQADIDKLMNRWHPGCTCIAVPVYKYDNYPTQSQEAEALKIYNAARKAVKDDLRAGESKMTTRLILNKMRELIYKPSAQQDETTLSRNVA